MFPIEWPLTLDVQVLFELCVYSVLLLDNMCSRDEDESVLRLIDIVSNYIEEWIYTDSTS